MTDILKWFLIGLSIPLIVLLVKHTMKRARALSERIDEYKEEMEAQSKQPGPINPYQQMADIFDTGADKDDKGTAGSR